VSLALYARPEIRLIPYGGLAVKVEAGLA
jgi:hypothetical protein